MNITTIINNIKSALPVGTSEAELTKVLTDLGIIPAPIPATPATPVSSSASTINAINECIDKLVASEVVTNNGGNNMNEFTITGTTTASTEITWKSLPQFTTLRRVVNDCRCNPNTWYTFFTDTKTVGFSNITKIHNQLVALSELYPEDQELKSIVCIVTRIGEIIQWGDVNSQTLEIFRKIQKAYECGVNTPTGKGSTYGLLCAEIEPYADILNENETLFNKALAYFGETFVAEVKQVQRLVNISKIDNDSKSTNAPAPVNQCTRSNAPAKKNK